MRVFALGFIPSPDGDIVSYSVTIRNIENNEVALNFDIPVDETFVVNGEGKYEIKLNNVPNGDQLDGVFNISIIATDDGGNKSTTATLDGVLIDFLAPAPPTDVYVREVITPSSY